MFKIAEKYIISEKSFSPLPLNPQIDDQNGIHIICRCICERSKHMKMEREIMMQSGESKNLK